MSNNFFLQNIHNEPIISIIKLNRWVQEPIWAPVGCQFLVELHYKKIIQLTERQTLKSKLCNCLNRTARKPPPRVGWVKFTTIRRENDHSVKFLRNCYDYMTTAYSLTKRFNEECVDRILIQKVFFQLYERWYCIITIRIPLTEQGDGR